MNMLLLSLFLSYFILSYFRGLSGRGKKDRPFSKFSFLPKIFRNELYSTFFTCPIFCPYLLVRKNFYSSESILSVFVESGHGKPVAGWHMDVLRERIDLCAAE